jgi:UDP:flavonoid glycosyltransferase YjiC (YdhE family)
MRVLFTTQPGDGHYQTIAPVAAALQRAGHEVTVACSASFVPTVEGHGLPAFACGYDWLVATSPYTFQSREGAAPVPAGREWLRRQAFLRLITERMLDDLLVLGRAWMPDLVARETAELAGCVAAEHWAIPHVVIGKMLGADYRQRIRHAPLLAMMRMRAGLPPDPEVAMPYRYLQLIPEPPSFHPPDEPLAPVAHFVRPGREDRTSDDGVPPWLESLHGLPVVHATLGTVMNRSSSLLESILHALRDEPVHLILTIGRNQDPARYGPQPDHVRIARYIPHSLLLPHCDLVLTQGSIHSVIAALAHGLPLVLLPIAGEQPHVAARCAAIGVGRVLDSSERTPEAIRGAVRAVLSNHAYARQAQCLRAEIAAMPGIEHAVGLLERLAEKREPLLQ